MATSPLVPGSTSGQNDRILGRGHGTAALGPSDSSDSGSDLAGQNASDDDLLDLEGDAAADTDAEGTGERLTAGQEPDVRIGSDIGLDRIVSADDAGLGGGLDQAEEAQLGITDEELAELARTRSPKR